MGANELGYLMFTLTPQGKAMLIHARGNQLAAHVTAVLLWPLTVERPSRRGG